MEEKNYCVFCNSDMIRVHVEWEDGSVSSFWGCDCETPEEVEAKIKKGHGATLLYEWVDNAKQA